MDINIEDIAEEKGKVIAKAIASKHYEYPYTLGKIKSAKKNFLSDFLKGFFKAKEQKIMEREIYGRSLHEATAFFLNHGDAKFDDEIIKVLKFHLEERLKHPNKIKKLKQEELLAMVIKIYVIDYLLEWEGIII